MIIRNLERFFSFSELKIEDIIKFLDRSLNNNIQKIEDALNNLRFEDNFKCQRIKLDGVNTSGKIIKHNLNAQISGWLVLNGISGVLVENIKEGSIVSRDKILIKLDNSIYNSNTNKNIDIIIFI